MPFLYLGYIPHHPTMFLNLGYKPVSSKDGWVYNSPGLSHEFRISTSRMDSSADTARLLKSWGMGRGLKAKAPVPAPRVGDWPGAPGAGSWAQNWGGLNMTQHRKAVRISHAPKKGRIWFFEKSRWFEDQGTKCFESEPGTTGIHRIGWWYGSNLCVDGFWPPSQKVHESFPSLFPAAFHSFPLDPILESKQHASQTRIKISTFIN
jgi:hypothetical protein